MPLRLGCLLVLPWLLAVARPGTPQPSSGRDADQGKPSRTDHHGDPLPQGAKGRLGTLRLRYQERITSAAFSPDGKLLASASKWGHGFRLWDTATGKEVGRFEGFLAEGGDVLAFSPSGKLIAGTVWAGEDDKQVNNLFLWDVDRGKEVRRLRGHRSIALAARFVEGDKTLVSVGKHGTVRWWDVASGKLTRAYEPFVEERNPEGKAPRKIVEFDRAVLSRDGRILAGAFTWVEGPGGRSEYVGPMLLVWDLEQKRLLLRTRDLVRPWSFDLSADGKLLATVLSAGEEVSLRETATGKVCARLKEPDPKRDGSLLVAFAPDGKTLAVLTQGLSGARLWDLATRKPVWQLGRRSGESEPPPGALALSADGERLSLPIENTLVLWDVRNRREVPRFDGHRDTVTHLHFSADGRRLVSGSGGYWEYPGEAITWDAATWRAVGLSRTKERQHGCLVPASPDHRRYLMCKPDEGDRLYVHDARTGEAVCRLQATYQADFSGAGFFSPNNRLVVIPGGEELGRDKRLLLDAVTGKRLGVLPYRHWSVRLAFSPDNKAVAWSNEDGTVEVVEVVTGRRVRQLGKPRDKENDWEPRSSLAFSSNGRYLASWDSREPDVILWEVATGKLHRRLPGKPPEIVYLHNVSLAFSPDGKSLAVGAMGGENPIQLWELATGKLRQEIRGHLGPVLALAFSPDGRFLASGSADTTVLIWDLAALAGQGRPR